MFTLSVNSLGANNSATGAYALNNNSTGNNNTAMGERALNNNSTSSNNTAFGASALYFNQGDVNTAMGYNALVNTSGGFQNTSVGANSLTVNTNGAYNTAIGYNTGPNANTRYNTTCVGIDATATGSDMVRIGNIFVGSIGGYQNWTNISDGRFKENVQENVPGLSFITQLRPVTYQVNRYKINEMNGVDERRKQIINSAKNKADVPVFLTGDKYSEITTGFIAQEVETAAKKLGFNFSGVDKPKNFYGLRYAEFVVPLVKGMQEQQVIIEDQNKRIDRLEKLVKELSEKVK
jgi:hypothetical protein